jgi:DUF177 domain-containing protein
MLRVDLRELRKGPVETVGQIPARDPLFEGLELHLAEPLRVTGLLEPSGRDDFLWRGQFEGQVMLTCRRCLQEFTRPFDSRVEVLFSPDPELQDDPSVYPLPENPSQVDLTGAVREELALAVPAYALCREDCRGLCQSCGAELNLGPCGCSAPSNG